MNQNQLVPRVPPLPLNELVSVSEEYEPLKGIKGLHPYQIDKMHSKEMLNRIYTAVMEKKLNRERWAAMSPDERAGTLAEMAPQERAAVKRHLKRQGPYPNPP